MYFLMNHSFKNDWVRLLEMRWNGVELKFCEAVCFQLSARPEFSGKFQQKSYRMKHTDSDTLKTTN